MTPELRFPGFEGEWARDDLGNRATFSKGRTLSKSDLSSDGRTLAIHYGQIYTTYTEVIENVVSRTDKQLSELHLSQGNEVIVPASGETPEDIATAACIIHKGIAIGGDLNVIRGEWDGRFLARYLSGAAKGRLVRQAQGNSVVHIGSKHLEQVALNWPSLAEQRKIATFLDTVAERIALAERRRDGLVDYKRGLMQALFSRRLRFRRDDGTEFPEGEQTTFGSLVTWHSTNSLSRSALTDDPASGIQNIHYGDIHGRFPSRFQQSSVMAPFVAVGALPRAIRDDEYLRQGDLIIADASEDQADIGKALEIVQAQPRSLIAGLHTYVARPKRDRLVHGFGGYLLASETVRRQIMRVAQGISVLGISKGEISKVSVHLPHPDEQRKIADALTALDDRIAAANARLDALKEWRRGLLQKMFVR